jgi:hypothetical protein
MELNALLSKLKLEHLEPQIASVCEQAASQDLDYPTFLTRALAVEWQGRQPGPGLPDLFDPGAGGRVAGPPATQQRSPAAPGPLPVAQDPGAVRFRLPTFPRPPPSQGTGAFQIGGMS